MIIPLLARNPVYRGTPSLAVPPPLQDARDFAANDADFSGNRHADPLFAESVRLLMRTGQ